MPEAYIVDAVRTPVGKRGGGLSQVHPADLLAHRPRQMPSRQPLPRIRRQQVHLITAAATSEVVPHNHIFPGQSPFPRINTPT